MKFIETEQIAEVSRYMGRWAFYVVGGEGERLSYVEKDEKGYSNPITITRYATKAEAVAELKKQFPEALVLEKREFQSEWSMRCYRGDNS